MNYLHIANWWDLQHYHDGRRPEWIKAYVERLNPLGAYAKLSDAAKLTLWHLELLAAKHGNNIKNNVGWIKGELGALTPKGLRKGLDELLESGLVLTGSEETAASQDKVRKGLEGGSRPLPVRKGLEEGSREFRDEPPLARASGVSYQSVFDSLSKFNELWKLILSERIPNPVHKSAALRHFRKTVSSDEDFAAVLRARQNYAASDRVKRGYVQDASTWFNNWRDWENYDERRTPNSTATPSRTARTTPEPDIDHEDWRVAAARIGQVPAVPGDTAGGKNGPVH